MMDQIAEAELEYEAWDLEQDLAREHQLAAEYFHGRLERPWYALEIESHEIVEPQIFDLDYRDT